MLFSASAAPSETAFDTSTAQSEAWADCLLLHERQARGPNRGDTCSSATAAAPVRQPSTAWSIPPVAAHLAALSKGTSQAHPETARAGHNAAAFDFGVAAPIHDFLQRSRFTATLSSPGAPCQGSRGQGVHSRTKLGKVSNRSPRVLPIALKNMCFCVATLADGPSVYWETIRRYREN